MRCSFDFRRGGSHLVDASKRTSLTGRTALVLDLASVL